MHELDKWVTHWMEQMPDGHTDKTRFRKAMADLGVQDGVLADKVFAAFDTDGSCVESPPTSLKLLSSDCDCHT